MTLVSSPTARSVQPPKKPAAIPAAEPIVAEMATATTEMRSEARIPAITREATSRPNWSVPIQCAVDGAAKRSAGFCSSGG